MNIATFSKNALLAAFSATCVLGAVSYWNGSEDVQSPPSTTVGKEQWDNLLRTGLRIGPPNALLTVVEFGDFECPACARFAPVLDSVREKYPQDFAVAFHHFPLPYHKLAMPLARAANCANVVNRFESFYRFAYGEHQVPLFERVSSFENSLPEPSKGQFHICVESDSAHSNIDGDFAIAKNLRLSGTPALIVDGYIKSPRPSAGDLIRLVEERVARLR